MPVLFSINHFSEFHLIYALREIQYLYNAEFRDILLINYN